MTWHRGWKAVPRELEVHQSHDPSTGHPRPFIIAGLPRRTHRALAHTTATVWLLATGEDLRYPATEGARPTLRTRLMHRYLNRLGPVAAVNRTINAAFLEVANLVHPPTALFRPSVLLPALRGATPHCAHRQ